MTIEFSPNWEAPEHVPVGKKKVQTALGQALGKLQVYVNSSQNSAVVVAGYHHTQHDTRNHITVRCNDNPGGHQYTFHVYLDKSGAYYDQTQTYP
jgi:hypothetical protein